MPSKFTPARIALLFAFAIITQNIFAQNAVDNQKALSLVKKNAKALGYSDADIKNYRISDAYVDALSGATLVYLQQTYLGIDVDKSIQVLAFKNESLVSSAGKPIRLNQSNNTAFNAMVQKNAKPTVSVESAIKAAAQHLNLAPPSMAQRLTASGQDFSRLTEFGDLGIAKESVGARLVWVPQKTFQRVKLAWEVNISPKKTFDNWRVIVDAAKGDVIKKESYVIAEHFEKSKDAGSLKLEKSVAGNSVASNTVNSAVRQTITDVTYRVIPFPVQAPSFPGGGSALVTNPWEMAPANSGATPFIWNDDGSRQYKFTRGNNVLAQEDVDGYFDNGQRAKGTTYGKYMYFDYIPDYSKQPTDSVNQGFAITNLFYWNNIMHDLSYQYGFDEVSGNFQQNNLGKGGKGYDYVQAFAQSGYSFNNAMFGTDKDGRKPYMAMFLWSSDPTKGFTINSPSSLPKNMVSVESGFSTNNLLVNVGPVTGDVVMYLDAADTLNDACSDAGNTTALSGKIVLINRGLCNFTDKVKRAELAGAIAVIMVDNVPGEYPIPMGGSDTSITTPAVMISYEDGQKIKDVLNGGTKVNVTLTAPPYIDGDLDASVICHEYTHGISNRLTGGPSTASCLNNAEQMGEGWSDYVSLMTITNWKKARKNDGALATTMGTYVLAENPDGAGIREYPYSTNMGINPHTYADIAATGGEEHAIGEIWTTILWDMTWFIIQDEGINKNIYNANGAGGNSIAYKLVMEGMKLQPCSPGFVDGRDAILKADTLLYGGKHSCAIWKAFARRGVGVGASQGSSQIAGDEKVDYALSSVFITKHAPKTAAPGKVIEYVIGLKARAVCGASIKPNYIVTDSLPGNVTYISSDGVYNAAKNAVTFRNIDMSDGDTLTYKIKVKVNNDAAFADTTFINDPVISPLISDIWVPKAGKQLSFGILDLGIYFYYSNDASIKDNEYLVTKSKYIVPGVKTTFSFWHEVISDDFNNGAVIEITTDAGKTWQDLGPYMDPSGFVYNEGITGNSYLKGRKAFAGFGYGYTTIDLSSFAGKAVKIRFVYATSDGSYSVPDGGTGWIIDDILLSASAKVPNIAKLYTNKWELKGYSSVETKVKGRNVKANFIAVKHNEDAALLSWNIPVEPNGKYLVERSTDNGISFTEIGVVNSASSKEDAASYSFTDASPASGINIYRINTVKANDASDYSEAKALMFNDKSIQVYPNPAKDKVSIYIPKNDKTVTIQLTNESGRQIKTYKVNGNSIQLKLPQVAAGSYYLNIIKEDGTTTRSKLIVQ